MKKIIAFLNTFSIFFYLILIIYCCYNIYSLYTNAEKGDIFFYWLIAINLFLILNSALNVFVDLEKRKKS